MKKFIAFAIAALTIVGAAFGAKETVNGVEYNYSIENGQATIESRGLNNPAISQSTSGELVIPSTLGGCPVTEIGRFSFNDCKALESVTIPNSVTKIVLYAFCGCKSLKSITIPNSVTTIEWGAFSGCKSLTSITIPNGVTTIWEEAFFGCESLKSITIPNSVTEIGSWAFFCCTSLTSITIPNSVTMIGEGTFAGCVKLQAINVAEENPGYRSVAGVLYSKDGGTLLAVPGALTSITIPNSVTTIGEDAFFGCKSLTSIKIPNSVTTIGDLAFGGCKSLTSITIPKSVTEIGENAFCLCSLRDVYVDKGCSDRVRKLLEGAGVRGDLEFHEPFSIVDILVRVGAVALLGGAVCIVLIRRKKRR